MLYLIKPALKEVSRPGRALIATLLALAPAAIALAWRWSAGPTHFPRELAYNSLESGFVFSFTLVILTVMLATGVISQELEQKTIVYLLTRPVRRISILLSRFAAALLMIVATSWVSTLALALTTYGLAHLHGSPVGRDLLILPIGALAYGAVFLCLATLIARPLLWGLLFAFGWEWWVPSLPGNFRMASLMAYLRVLAPHATQDGGEATDIFAILSGLVPTKITAALSWEVLLTVIVVAMAGAMVVFSTKEYVPRDDAI
ncbi:MAG TPA: ABC transporter permease [Armatimonadota bacterium]